MVSFQCDGCSDVIKKPKLDQHRSRCRTSFTCLDCSKTFPTPADYKGHTSCVSEAEKYEKSVYQGPRQGNGRGRGGFQQYGSRNQHQNRFGRGGNQYQRSSYQPSGANGTPLGGSPKMTWSPSPPAAQSAKENDKTSEKRKHTQENSEVREEVQPSKKIKFEDGSSHPVGLVTITDIIGDEIIAEDKEKSEKKKDRKDKKDKKRKGEGDVEIRTNIQPEGKQWTPSELPPPQSSENASETAAEPDLSETSSTKKSKRKDETAEDKKARKEEKRRRKLAAKAEVQEDNGPTAVELSSKKSKKSKTPKDTEQQDVITPHDNQHGDGETESRNDEKLEKKRKKERSGEKRKDKESRKKAEEVTV